MQEKPTFSIIIPVYNAERYLKQCLSSIQKQTFADFEVVLVDDGSKDNSLQICNSFAEVDSRFKVYHQGNEGVVSARKKGFDESSGEYISCIDSDDWVDVCCYEKVKAIIDSFLPDIVCFGIVYENNKESKPVPMKEHCGFYDKEKIRREIYPSLIQTKDASYFSPNMASKIFRRNVFEKNIYTNKKTRIGEDGACTLCCVYSSDSIFIMKECFYHYRYNPLSATNKGQIYDWNGPYFLYQFISEKVNLDESDFEAQLNRRIAHSLFNVALSQFNKDNLSLKIFKDIKKQLYSDRYKNFINKACFSGSFKAKIMEMILKYKMIWCLFLISKMK